MAILFTVVLLLTPVAAQTNAVWTAGTGNWNVAGNWSPSGIPNGAFNVFIDNGNAGNAMVAIPASTSFTVDSLTIDVGDVLLQNNNTDFTIQTDISRPASGMIANSGQIMINNAGSSSDMRIDAAVSLFGAGTITLGGTTAGSRILDEGGGLDGVLTNVDNLIQGKGQIGVNLLQVINEVDGLIVANDSTGTLTLDPRPADPMINMGLLLADGGNLVLTAGAFTNTGGVIEALPSSTVTITGNAAITGGTLQTSGDGQIEVPSSQGASLTNVTIDGTLNARNNTDLSLNGTIFSSGNTINMINAGSNTDLRIDTTVSLEGGGTVTLGGTITSSRILDEAGGADGVLTNVDNLIQGKGQIGANTLQVINGIDGLIVANDATGSLTLDPRPADPMINLGLLQADGGNLVLTDGSFANTGGLIEALPSSTVTLNGGAAVTGGTLRTSGDGQIEVPASQAASLTNVTIEGTLNARNNTNLDLDGTISNSGNTINILNASSNTDLRIDTSVSLEGGGTVTLGGTVVSSRILDEAGGADGVLTNVDNLIQGKGQIGVNSLLVINQADGMIVANDATGALTLDPRTADPMINRGMMQAAGGGNLVITAGQVDNSNGTIEALNASTVSLTAGGAVSGGNLQSSGSGTVQVPSSTVASIADLTVAGTITQNNNSDLFLSGNIQNNGTLNVSNAGSNTELFVNSSVTVSGPGSINLMGTTGTASRIIGTGDIHIVGGALTGRGQILVPSILEGVTISPGAPIGTLMFSSPSHIRGNSIFRTELNAATATPGTNSDLISSTSTINLQQTGSSNFTIRLVTLNNMGNAGPLADFDPAQSYVFRIAAASSFQNYSPGRFQFDLTGFANAITGHFSIAKGPIAGGEALLVKYGQFRLGDVNHDGVVSLLDVSPFVTALLSGVFNDEADINCDGIVSLLDVAPFVALLTN